MTKELQVPIDLPSIIYRAKWVLPIDRPPLENGAVLVRGHRIVSVDKFAALQRECQRVVDLGVGAIIPGLVNAHTHLEFSNLSQPLGHPGIPFTDWIRLIVTNRISSNEANSKAGAIQSGLEEIHRTGTWTVGEIATLPMSLDDYRFNSGFSMVSFLEQLGNDPTHFADKQDELARFFDQTVDDSNVHDMTLGVSPHAPYSVHPQLLRQICSLAQAKKRMVAMHIAETPEEIELIENGTGKFVALLKDFGVWNPGMETHQSVIGILQHLSEAPRSLLVHGNYLRDSDLDFVANHRRSMSVVFCPRTHRFFAHPSYPLKQMRQRGINVALGTDSRASNPDLNLWTELKLVAAMFHDLRPIQILEMGTINGARALGCDDQVGSLAAGKKAALSFVALDGSTTQSLSSLDLLMAPESTCVPLSNPA